MDLDVLCPMCEDSVMVEENNLRICKECGHEMSLMEYQIYLASRFEALNTMLNLPNAVERRSFGSRRK